MKLADCSGSNEVSIGHGQQEGARDSSDCHNGERKPCHWACLCWRRKESDTQRTVCWSSCHCLVARFVDRRGSSTRKRSRKLCTVELWGKTAASEHVDVHR